jgi:hypothetical protein
MSLEQSPSGLAPATHPVPPFVSAMGGTSVGAEARLSEALSITKDMFATSPSVQTMSDPDDPDHPFILLTVHAQGDTRELIERHVEWGSRVRPINLDLSLRLAIVPAD